MQTILRHILWQHKILLAFILDFSDLNESRLQIFGIGISLDLDIWHNLFLTIRSRQEGLIKYKTVSKRFDPFSLNSLFCWDIRCIGASFWLSLICPARSFSKVLLRIRMSRLIIEGAPFPAIKSKLYFIYPGVIIKLLVVSMTSSSFQWSWY